MPPWYLLSQDNPGCLDVLPSPVAKQLPPWVWNPWPKWLTRLSFQEYPTIPLLLTLLAFITRYYRLLEPDAVVFDEHYFGKFTNFYHKEAYYFDIHPPLAKLTFFYVGKLFGYVGAPCNYEHIGDHFDAQCRFDILRIIAGKKV